MKYAINATGVDEPLGFYSNGTSAGRMIFISGQVALDASGVAQQVHEILTTIEKLLGELQCNLSDVASLTIFMRDIAQLDEVDAVLKQRFDTPAPARSVAEVSKLPHDALIEISCIACR